MTYNDQYIPHDNEEYMCERQVEYFRNMLIDWKNSILEESKQTLNSLQYNENLSDIADRASAEIEKAVDLRNRDRQRKLLGKIESALQRIKEGEYGYCEDTGEKITITRLLARPITNFCFEAQEKHEQQEKLKRRN